MCVRPRPTSSYLLGMTARPSSELHSSNKYISQPERKTHSEIESRRDDNISEELDQMHFDLFF